MPNRPPTQSSKTERRLPGKHVAGPTALQARPAALGNFLNVKAKLAHLEASEPRH